MIHFDQAVRSLITFYPKDGQRREPVPEYQYLTDLVLHRDTQGDIFAVHTPLTKGGVSCSICTTVGVKVWVD